MACDGDQRARHAAARAAVAQIEPGMTIGLGSGRAVFRAIEEIALRWPQQPPLRAVCASLATEAHARAAGIEPVELDGSFGLDVALDGADEIDPALNLIKGGGAALLREKLVAASADRFVVVAEAPKLVDRLGATRPLPVEVVRFAWPETRARLLELVPQATLRPSATADPLVTDEGHYLLDCSLPADVALDGLAAQIKALVGVIDHGLFLHMADAAVIGAADGSVETLTR